MGVGRQGNNREGKKEGRKGRGWQRSYLRILENSFVLQKTLDRLIGTQLSVTGWR